jgi:hypothetical protein
MRWEEGDGTLLANIAYSNSPRAKPSCAPILGSSALPIASAEMTSYGIRRIAENNPSA